MATFDPNELMQSNTCSCMCKEDEIAGDVMGDRKKEIDKNIITLKLNTD